MTRIERTGSRVRQILVGLLSVVALLVLGPALPADAHARLVSVIPAAGAVLAKSPTVVTLSFDEPVRTVPKGFQLYDRGGAARSLTVTATDSTVVAQLPGGLHDGSYGVGWRVVSADSHPISGALTFAIGQPDSTVPQIRPQPSSATISTTLGGLNAVGYLALMTLVGLGVFEVAMLRPVVDKGGDRRWLKAFAAVTAVVAYAILVPLASVRESGGSFSDLLTTPALSRPWRSAGGLTLVLVLLGSVLLVMARRLRSRRLTLAATMGGAALAMGSVLPVGHTRSYGPGWLVLSADLAHAAAAAVWFGGLIGLSFFLVEARRSSLDPRRAAAVLGRFSTTAGALVAVVAASGTALAVIMVGSVRTLLESSYGHLLLVKIGLAAVVGGLALWNRTVLLPNLGHLDTHPRQWGRLTQAVVAEVIVLVLVISATAVLGMQAPGAAATDRDGGGRATRANAATTLITDLGSGHFYATLDPGSLGPNVVTFRLTDAADQPITPVALPEVRVSEPNLSLGPLVAQVEPGEAPGTYRALVTIPVPGQWRINTAARVTEFEQPAATVDVTVIR